MAGRFISCCIALPLLVAAASSASLTAFNDAAEALSSAQEQRHFIASSNLLTGVTTYDALPLPPSRELKSTANDNADPEVNEDDGASSTVAAGDAVSNEDNHKDNGEGNSHNGGNGNNGNSGNHHNGGNHNATADANVSNGDNHKGNGNSHNKHSGNGSNGKNGNSNNHNGGNHTATADSDVSSSSSNNHHSSGNGSNGKNKTSSNHNGSNHNANSHNGSNHNKNKKDNGSNNNHEGHANSHNGGNGNAKEQNGDNVNADNHSSHSNSHKEGSGNSNAEHNDHKNAKVENSNDEASNINHKVIGITKNELNEDLGPKYVGASTSRGNTNPALIFSFLFLGGTMIGCLLGYMLRLWQARRLQEQSTMKQQQASLRLDHRSDSLPPSGAFFPYEPAAIPHQSRAAILSWSWLESNGDILSKLESDDANDLKLDEEEGIAVVGSSNIGEIFVNLT